MISRRLLRIKVLHILYAYYLISPDENGSSRRDLNSTEKELFHSINKTYELYHYIMLLVIDITDYARKMIEQAQAKKVPTYTDLNPNTKFVDNKFIAQLVDNINLRAYLNVHRLSWINYPELIKNLYLSLIESEVYTNYMSIENPTYEDDKQLIIDILATQISDCDQIYQALEEQSIYWNDDVEFVISLIIKTFDKFKMSAGGDAKLMPLFKDDDDVDFTKRLFRKTIFSHTENFKLIESFTKNWDIERITYMDILLIQMAITELIEFPSIPTKVTLNEYIEISKYYSTPKSSTFVNGILDKIITKLQQSNQIQKTGRGLIE